MLHGDPPRSVPKLMGHLSFGRPRSRDAIQRTFRKKPIPRHRGAVNYAAVSRGSLIPHNFEL